MTSYTPSDHPQPLGSKEGGRIVDIHEDEYRTYGPVPPNYEVVRINASIGKLKNQLAIRYTEQSSGSTRRNLNHPLSPAGLAETPNPIIHAEPLIDRKISPGFFEAPITYKAGTQVQWIHYKTWQGALAAALASHGITSRHSNQVVTEADIKATCDSMDMKVATSSDNSVLYHPTDRSSMVFKDEPAVAAVARKHGLSLILVCPYVEHDGTGYNRLYNIKGRPPIYARWSAGRQGQNPPLVLGCLTRQVSTRGSKGFDVLWFYLKPNANAVPNWYTGMFDKSLNIKSIAETLGFPVDQFEPQVFLWSLVSLHRRRVLGYAISDDHLGSWICQFGNHLVINCKSWNKPHPSSFAYDAEKLATYKTEYPKASLTFARLTQWILSPYMRANGVWIGQYAKLWDDAIDAQIQYRLNKTDANWDTFGKAMEATRKLPF